MDGSADKAREVNTQERKIWVWDGVDHVLDEVAARFPEFVVLASERNDLRFGIRATQPGHAVALESGAIDDVARRDLTLWGVESVATRHRTDGADP